MSRTSRGDAAVRLICQNEQVAPFRDILTASPKLIFEQRQQSTFAIVSQTSGLRIN
jgi:hypothetical protein